MKTYIILLRRLKSSDPNDFLTLHVESLAWLNSQTGARFLDSYSFAPYGAYDAMLICQADDNAVIGNVIKKLVGWETTSLLVSPSTASAPGRAVQQSRA